MSTLRLSADLGPERFKRAQTGQKSAEQPENPHDSFHKVDY